MSQLLRGCDVSAYQSLVDWPTAADRLSLRFVLVKVAEGLGKLPDAYAEKNLSGARAAGLVVGGYFFLHPEEDVEAQAKLHCSLASSVGAGRVGDLPFAVDIESPAPDKWAGLGLTSEELRRRALAYVEAVEEISGSMPMIYTYPDFWSHLEGSLEPRFSRSPLWMASYSSKGWPLPGQAPFIPRPWTSWAFWQWTDSGYLPNGAKVDQDCFWGEETDLQALLKKEEPVADLKPLFVPPEDDNS